jgi:acyl-CoA thioesterase FadM
MNAVSDEHLATATQTAVYVADRRPVRVDDAVRAAVVEFDTAVES